MLKFIPGGEKRYFYAILHEAGCFLAVLLNNLHKNTLKFPLTCLRGIIVLCQAAYSFEQEAC